MDHYEGAGSQRADRVEVDRRVRVEFSGTQISSDGALMVMRGLDDALGPSDLAVAALRDTRRSKNTVHRLDGLFWQSVFERLVGYHDVNEADRLALDPVVREVVGGRAVDAQAASASQMGRFETETLVLPENREALANLNGQWIDRFHDRNGLKFIVLDIESSVSPNHGDPEKSARKGISTATAPRVFRHARAITFQLAEVVVTGPMVRAIFAAIRRLPSSAAFERLRYARYRDLDPN